MNRKSQRIGQGVLVFSLCAAFGLVAPPAKADSAGETLFKSKCAGCHGADGKGDTGMGRMFKIRDLGSAEVQSQSDEELTKIISDGKNKMPAYGKSLNAGQIKELVGFIRTLKK